MTINRRIEVTDYNHVTVVRFLDQEIRHEMHIKEIDGELTRLLDDEKPTKVVLNFAKVKFLSSAWLVKLVAFNKKLKAGGGELKLANIRPEVKEVFTITKLDTLFAIRGDVVDAIESF